MFPRPLTTKPEARRSFLFSMLGLAGGAAAVGSFRPRGPQDRADAGTYDPRGEEVGLERADRLVGAGEPIRITQLETFLVQPRWLFLKVHTDAGIVGLGEPIVEGRAETCQTAIKELESYLIGQDPRPVAHHWQAMYRHAF